RSCREETFARVVQLARYLVIFADAEQVAGQPRQADAVEAVAVIHRLQVIAVVDVPRNDEGRPFALAGRRHLLGLDRGRVTALSGTAGQLPALGEEERHPLGMLPDEVVVEQEIRQHNADVVRQRLERVRAVVRHLLHGEVALDLLAQLGLARRRFQAVLGGVAEVIVEVVDAYAEDLLQARGRLLPGPRPADAPPTPPD